MKSHITLFVLLFTLFSFSQNKITTYYFIRHAEKVDDSKNPDLSSKGLERALLWSKIFSDINFDAIYSTDFKRTLQTATPIAANRNLEIIKYDPKIVDIQEFKTKTLGQTVLIVGHSNTTPEFVNKIIDKIIYASIEDSIFGNLYIVTLNGTLISYQLLKLP
ncbi:phosphoglycerate mutase family protein [Flavobacterium sp.]|uniref:SixA phosphatase family protein n=1 Tax=Flavobacterium sp. TaxID=239 RepID=UPI00286C6CF2|nr:phosphoglycerate mutase family protein [Flavobacterium sp.]